MRDKPKPPSKELPERLKKWFQGARGKSSRLFRRPKWWKPGALGTLRGRIPKKLRDFDLDLKKVELKNVSEYSGWIRFGLVVLAVYLLAELTARTIGLFVRPVYPQLPRQAGDMAAAGAQPQEDYEAILRRNIFNVEGKIPDPFDQGMLDCFAQARPTSQRISLLGTIVMGDERYSTALVQEDGNAQKIGVKKGERFFDGKFEVLKIERKKLCFQVMASQEMEFIEIPDDSAGIGVSAPTFSGGGASAGGIVPVSETEYAVEKGFLDKQLLNLNEILQTARAVPYVEPGTGKFKGFLIQSIDGNSPFGQLGIRQGDILTGVNDIVLDNAGKGLEAFQRLRNTPTVDLKIIRGGQETSLNYKVK